MSSIECPTQFVGRAVCGRQQQTLQGYEKNYGVSITVPREAICGHKTISITGRRSKEVVAAIRNEIARLQQNATKSADWKRNQRQRAKMLRGPRVPDHQQHVVKVAATVNPFAGFDVEEEQDTHDDGNHLPSIHSVINVRGSHPVDPSLRPLFE